MISQGMLMCLLFTLSVGICLFMYIHQKTSQIQKNINNLVGFIRKVEDDVKVGYNNTVHVSEVQPEATVCFRESRSNSEVNESNDKQIYFESDLQTMDTHDVNMDVIHLHRDDHFSNEKIDVSDDDDDDVSDDEEDVSEDDDVSDDEDDISDDEKDEDDTNDIKADILDHEHVFLESQEQQYEDNGDDLEDEIESQLSNSLKTVNFKEHESGQLLNDEVVQLNEDTIQNIEESVSNDNNKESQSQSQNSSHVPNYRNFSVNELKKWIKQNNIKPPTSMKKMKKNDLIHLLDQYYNNEGSEEDDKEDSVNVNEESRTVSLKPEYIKENETSYSCEDGVCSIVNNDELQQPKETSDESIVSLSNKEQETETEIETETEESKSNSLLNEDSIENLDDTSHSNNENSVTLDK